MSRTFAAVCLVLCLGVAVARAQAPAANPPAPAPGASKDYISLVVTNDCSKTILAAVVAANMEGKWEAQGFWRLAPGESAEAAHTTNRNYYVYGHELGDPECTLGCWAGSNERDLQGEKWPFLEKQMKAGVSLGSTVVHRFTC